MEHQEFLLNLFIILGVAVLFMLLVYRIARRYFVEEVSGCERNSSLDGPRGLAALSVAIHHSFFFFGYAKYGK